MPEPPERSERVEEINRDSGGHTVKTARCRIRMHVLTSARLGNLGENWRDTLTTDVLYTHEETGKRPPAAQACTAHCDAEELALREVVTSPPSDWEPYVAAGDWRRALDAWHHAYIDVLDEHATTQEQWWQRLRAVGNPTLPPTLADPFLSQMQRDQIGAQYRAGLAAGGVDTDWLGWYRHRISQWDTSGPAHYAALKQAVLDSMNNPDETVRWEALPDYWTRANH